MVAMKGDIPVRDVYSPKIMNLVLNRKAVIATDMLTARVQSSRFCPVLEGFFYMGTQSITGLRSVWYFRKGIHPNITREIDRRWVLS